MRITAVLPVAGEARTFEFDADDVLASTGLAPADVSLDEIKARAVQWADLPNPPALGSLQALRTDSGDVLISPVAKYGA